MGKHREMPKWKPRNTGRARNLRREATPAERCLWQYLSRGQLGARFSRQMPVGPYYADFLRRELKLVVECDGTSHDMRLGSDAARDRWMRDAGYAVLRFANETVLRESESAVRAIAEEVKRLQALQAHP